ncbi:MAG: hypothetical protein K2X29_12035 [Candidatus Obscuribacterales bacterium]|nr:hypothetical protein [Candidatus Obscuribacterales bacterium]
MKQAWLKVTLVALGLLLALPSLAQNSLEDEIDREFDLDTSDKSVSPNTNSQQRVKRESPVLQEADAMMTKQVREVASWMQNYCSSNVFFPRVGDEQNWVRSQLTELVPYNPYDPNSLNQAESGVPIAAPLTGSGPGGEILSYDEQANEMIAQQDNRIQIQVDYSMTLEQARQYETNPPDDWQADAGTITIVSTNQGMNQNSPTDFFIVWGAGANGRPIRDPFTKRVLFVQGRWTQILGK